MQYVLQEKYGSEFNAGSKARNDVEAIAVMQGYSSIVMEYDYQNNSKSVFSKISKNVSCFQGWNKLIDTLQPGDTLFIQHPMQSGAVAAKAMLPKLIKKGIRIVAVIHDLASLRSMGEDNQTAHIHDHIILPQFDRVISHNDRMTSILTEKYGIPASQIVTLGIFDYLCEAEPKERHFDRSVVIAGNLNFEKCPYVRELIGTFEGTLHLYGVGLEERDYGENVHYHGSFPPEELPHVMEGSFGIVWDGTSVTTCAGNTGEYLKYNNPHKTSLYLAAGLPVVVWEQAAMAEFVTQHHVGITVDSLETLQDVMERINEKDYRLMCENAQRIGAKLRRGEYLAAALGKLV